MSPRPTISAVLIVKDEEDVLARSLDALSWVDELVVYDTGSTDRTKEVAARFTDLVVDGYWDDDFGGARNRAIEHATGDWILVVDADEVFDGDPAALRERLVASGAEAIVIPVNDERNLDGAGSVNIRAFRRDRGCYAGRLHEQVVARDGAGPLSTASVANVRLIHSGYSTDAVEKHDKKRRNLELARADLEREVAEGGAPAIVATKQVNLARSLIMAGELDAGLELAEEVFDGGLAPGGSLTQLANAVVGAALLRDDRERAERWLELWERVDVSPLWAQSARVEVMAALGDVDGVLDTLAVLPTTAVDSVKRRFDKRALVKQEAWALAERGDLRAAARVVVRAAAAGFVDVEPATVVQLLQATGQPLDTYVRVLGPGVWRHVAVACAQRPSSEAMRLLWAMTEHRPDDVAAMLCAAPLAPFMDLEALAMWSAALRRAGLSELCTLVAAADDTRRDLLTRALAAAMAVDIYQDGRALPALETVLAAVPAADEPALLAQLEIVAPGLVVSA